jgi:molybdopterin molybdotransferase
MDGFAALSRDTFGASETAPTYLTMIGEIKMGKLPAFSLQSGQCARIGTGGMMPEGSDCVVMVEHSRLVDPAGSTVEIARSVPPGGNVLGAADDAARGQCLLPAGQKLRSQDVGLLAALGVTEVDVVRCPKLGIISTGDEVVPVSASPGPGQVRDVNSHTLVCLARLSGAEPHLLGLVKDDETRLRAAVQRSLETSDLTLLSGGSSVGVRDLTREVFLSFGDAEVLVHGVSVAPGKPFIWVKAGDHHLLGLPGQVTSCVIAFHLFVEPMVERMLGRAARSFTLFPSVEARLTRNLPSSPGRETYIRVDLKEDPTGAVLAEPLFGRSGLLRTLTAAKGLLRVPLGNEGIEAGTMVQVLRFPA